MDNNAKDSPFALLTRWWLWAIICLFVLPPMEAAIWQLISGLSHLFLVGTLGLGVVAILAAFLAAYFDKKLLKAVSVILVCLFLSFIGYAAIFHYQDTAATPSVTRSAAIVGSGTVSESVTILKPGIPTLMYAAIGVVVAVLFVASILIFRRLKLNAVRVPRLSSDYSGRERQGLTAKQKESLMSQLSLLEPHKFGIVRDGLPDCVFLADQLHAVFNSLGWPSQFLPDQKVFDPILPGVRIRSKPEDKTATEVCRILSEVLGVSIGHDAKVTQNIDWFEIEIGRKPL